MTTKEKAKELFEKFKIETYSMDDKDWYISFDKTKEYINKVIDEIVAENQILDNFQVEFTGKLVERFDYWNDVRREIESI